MENQDFTVDPGYEVAIENWSNLSTDENGFGWLFDLFGTLQDIAKGIKALIGLV